MRASRRLAAAGLALWIASSGASATAAVIADFGDFQSTPGLTLNGPPGGDGTYTNATHLAVDDANRNVVRFNDGAYQRGSVLLTNPVSR